MKIIIKTTAFICFILIATTAESGDANKYILANNSMRAGIAYIPTISSGRIVGEPQLGQISYSPKVGYHFGVIGSYIFGKRNFVETGIMHQTHILQFNQKASTQFSFLNNALEKETTLRFASYSVPIRMLYYDGLFRFRRYLSVGPVFNFMYSRRQEETHTFEDNYPITDVFKNKSGFNMFSPEMRIGLGFEYDLENDLSFKVEPILSFGFYRGKTKANMITFGILIAAQLQQ